MVFGFGQAGCVNLNSDEHAAEVCESAGKKGLDSAGGISDVSGCFPLYQDRSRLLISNPPLTKTLKPGSCA
jgi:hypothetical protein